jgi:hypothetical protein
MGTKPHEEFASVIGKIERWVRIAGRIGSYFWARLTPVGAVGFDAFLDRHLAPVPAERLLAVTAPRYEHRRCLIVVKVEDYERVSQRTARLCGAVPDAAKPKVPSQTGVGGVADITHH